MIDYKNSEDVCQFLYDLSDKLEELNNGPQILDEFISFISKLESEMMKKFSYKIST